MIREKNFNLMCSEVLEILKYCPQSDVDKIPKKLKELFKQNKLENFEPKIDPNKSIFEQDVCEETIVMTFIIFRNYWATPDEKKQIDEILEQNQLKLEEKYSEENLFKQPEKTTPQQEEPSQEQNNTAMVEYKEGFITKLVKLIKNIFKKFNK